MNFGKLQTDSPTYDRQTKEFCQSMTFRSDKLRITSEAAGYIAAEAAKTFERVIRMNGFDDYVWPPDNVGCHGHADEKGLTLTFGTRADKKRQIILQ